MDEDTIFATLLFNTEAVPNKPKFPREIMDWTEEFYRPAFSTNASFALREHGMSPAPACLMDLSTKLIPAFAGISVGLVKVSDNLELSML